MAPVKFDDIGKTAKEVLNDDYKTSGCEFKAKQKTSFDGAVLTSTVDLFPAKDSCMTPAKLSWKLPKPLGCPVVSIDKLEMDKTGGVKIEASSEKLMKDVKVECKTDVSDISKLVAGITYTGIANAQLKVETKVMKPQDCVFEATCASKVGGADCTVGLKGTAANIAALDLGVRVSAGDLFGSLYAKNKFSAFSANCHYKLSGDVRAAASYEYGGKANGQFALGVTYAVKPGTTVKAKVADDQSISCSVKHDVSKGFTVLAGAKADPAKMSLSSYGISLSIE